MLISSASVGWRQVVSLGRETVVKTYKKHPALAEWRHKIYRSPFVPPLCEGWNNKQNLYPRACARG